MALPVVSNRLASMRRRWITRLGWYPGDWVWLSLPTLAVAATGAAIAIAVTEHRHQSSPSFANVAAEVPVSEPSANPQVAPASTTDTSQLATTPAPGGKVTNGKTPWPTNENGWTIVLVSYPQTFGQAQAAVTAKQAAKSGLDQVGVIDSDLYASLQPGYFVVFTGIYGSKGDADAAVATAKQAGFPGAYSREIAR